MRGGVGVARGAVEGEDLPAVAAIDLDFQLLKELAVALPGPVDLHFVAIDGDLDDGLEGGEIGRGLAGADGSEVEANRWGVGVDVFEFGNEIEDAVDGAAGAGNDAYGERGWGEDGKDERGRAIGELGLVGGGGAGFLPLTHAWEPGADGVDDPEGICDSGIALGLADAERGGVPGELVAEVFQPHELFGGFAWVVGLAGHTFGFRWR